MAFFELHDIKRDRIPYTTDHMWHLPWWTPTIQNTLLSNLRKTMISSTLAALVVEPANHIWAAMKTLNLAYEWPRNSSEWSIFVRESFKIPSFWAELRKKLVFGSLAASMDYGMRLSALHYFWGGTWSPNALCDMSVFKYLGFAMAGAWAICWTGIPFEVARSSYYADQTWPAELRKGYRSPLHALLKIPITEGPLYLFKGGLPIYFGNSMFTGWFFFTYLWLKNKLFFLWVYNDISYSWVKFWIMNFSWAIGSMWGYPFYAVKEMMDAWPKERGGRCTFEGSSWNAIKWLRLNFEVYNTNLMDGYWRWMRKQGLIFYLATWHADNMGIFTNHMTDYNTIENILGEEESD